MITYFLNCMGPVSTQWYADRGFLGESERRYNKTLDKWYDYRPILKHWATGRIDIHDDSPYGTEVGVPVMSQESWNMLGDWLDEYVTEEIDWNPTETFEKQTGYKIEWLES